MVRPCVVVALASVACGSSRPLPPPPPPPRPAVTPTESPPPPPTPPVLRLPGDVRPHRYALDLTIVPDQPTLTGRVHVDAEVVRPTRVVWLNATGLTIDRAAVGGRAARVVPGGDDFIDRWMLKTWSARARQLGWQRRRDDSDDRHSLRGSVLATAGWAGDRAVVADAARLARAWLADPSVLADDLVGVALALAARHGDAALFDRYLAAARAAGDRHQQVRLLGALASFRDPALATRALALVHGNEFDRRDTIGILYGLLGQRKTRELAWQFVQAHVDELLARMRGDEAAGFIGFAAGMFCDAAHADQAAALFATRVGKFDGAQHALDQAREAAAQCIATQARIMPSALRFLSRY